MKRFLKIFLFLLPLILLLAVSFVYFFCDTTIVFPFIRIKHAPVPFKEAKFEGGELRFINGVPVMTLRGSPKEMGRQAGGLCGAQIKALIREYLYYLFSDSDKMAAARQRARTMMKHIPPAYIEELRGMSETSGVTFEDLLVANTFIDYYKAFACSAFCVQADRAAAGRLLFGRNLDFPPLGVVQHYNMITVYHPNGRRAFAVVNWPGMIGAITAINDAGLTLAMLLSFDSSFDFDKTPSSLAFREIVEQYKTAREASDYLKKNFIASPYNLTVADAGGDALVVEAGPAHWRERLPVDGVLVCTNAYEEDLPGTRPLDGRYARLMKFAEERRGLIGVDDVKKALAMAYLPAMNVQAMVIVPRERLILLAIGDVPAAFCRYRLIDLAPLLE